jgi:hypothetical protein
MKTRQTWRCDNIDKYIIKLEIKTRDTEVKEAFEFTVKNLNEHRECEYKTVRKKYPKVAEAIWREFKKLIGKINDREKQDQIEARLKEQFTRKFREDVEQIQGIYLKSDSKDKRKKSKLVAINDFNVNLRTDEYIILENAKK